MRFLTRAGKKKCPSCQRDYRFTKIRQQGGTIYKRCPHCDHTLAKFSVKAALRRAANRGK